MSIGASVRRVLGPAFPAVGAVYRRVFVDINEVARSVPVLPQGSLLLDVGGGDGAILNPLLDRQPTLRVEAVDLAPEICQWVRPDLRSQVAVHAATSVRDWIDAGGPAVDAVLMSDVLHHVPPSHRQVLIRDVLDAFGANPVMLIVKDIAPQGPRSRLAFWADRNITGDRGVSVIGPSEVVNLVHSVDPELSVESTELQDRDHPNYGLVFRTPNAH